jgi:hypothetical protein
VEFGREAPVTAGPEERRAAAAPRHVHLRASDADREHVITTLKTAFVQGRLTKDELADRVGRALASRTHGELAGLTADIPAGLAAATPAGKHPRALARPMAGPAATVGAGVAVAPAVLVTAFFTNNQHLFKWLITIMIVYYLAWMVAGTLLLDSRRHGRSRGHPYCRGRRFPASR